MPPPLLPLTPFLRVSCSFPLLICAFVAFQRFAPHSRASFCASWTFGKPLTPLLTQFLLLSLVSDPPAPSNSVARSIPPSCIMANSPLSLPMFLRPPSRVFLVSATPPQLHPLRPSEFPDLVCFYLLGAFPSFASRSPRSRDPYRFGMFSLRFSSSLQPL